MQDVGLLYLLGECVLANDGLSLKKTKEHHGLRLTSETLGDLVEVNFGQKAVRFYRPAVGRDAIEFDFGLLQDYLEKHNYTTI